MKTDPRTIQQFITGTRECAMQMMQNAAYILKELPAIEMADPIRNQITELCQELIGTKHDLFGEISQVVDHLEQEHPDADLIDSAIGSMQRWMSESILRVHACVTSIQEEMDKGDASPLLGMLVMESAVNILNSVPTFPEREEETEADEQVDDTDDAEHEDQEEDDNSDCFAFHAEDSWPIGELIKVVRDLGDRKDLTKETREHLRVFLFAMERLPLITPGIWMTLRLRLEYGEDAEWIEIRMEGDEFALGRGSCEYGDADTETAFEVTSDFREGDAFTASQFAESFAACAEDVCREVVIEGFSDSPFAGWNLPQDKKRWGSLPNSFL